MCKLRHGSEDERARGGMDGIEARATRARQGREEVTLTTCRGSSMPWALRGLHPRRASQNPLLRPGTSCLPTPPVCRRCGCIRCELTRRQRCLCCSAASQPDNTANPPCQVKDGGRLKGEPAHLLCYRQSGGQQAPCFAHHSPCPQSASSGHCQLPPPFFSQGPVNRLGSLYEKKTVV